MISSKAAVLYAPGEPLRVAELTVERPRAGEVLVEIEASGLCHTDVTAIEGTNAGCVYPAVLGHEGAGRVVEIGPEVKNLSAGDHVIPLYGPECGRCSMCQSGRTNLCWAIKSTRDRGVMPEGSSRFHIDGEPVYHFMGTSTFSQYSVIPEIALAKIRKDAPLDVVCLFGCGVTTGVGAALKDVVPGDRVVVYGLGGIGMNVVQGARLAGASQILGVDTVPEKRHMAQQLGLTDFIDARVGQAAVVENVCDLTSGGADVAFECTGILSVMRQAIDSCRAGWGTCVLLGVEPPGSEVSFPPVLARYGRTIKGSYFGGVKGRSGLNDLIDLYMAGSIFVEPLITHRLNLEDINRGFELMATGDSLRSVVSFR